MQTMKIALLISALVSMALGLLMVYIGLQHNPMGEFCMNQNQSDCRLDWLYIMGLWLSWFIVLFVGQSFLIFLTWIANRALQRMRQKTARR
jgi:hypothetical protein